ncbi:MAG: EF2563 family selenium-dependent molybdenum hydroxylase system protein [Chloroflexi bacterium]|nr:MAG: EF2563 family selenium-dependent molybdenum hydroxylase system protein [Chloroflexota bacterium]MBL1195930.1 EF2563 family selenium-dependent molybdenum hydroxylase system protein [Chloroflexota bacterium]NOH13223.1 EF2563 family selenium-dependent molybdenum hydroxylase system protein [Chloroflexota bacterium]
MPSIVLIRGGGDLASGVALRLHRADIQVLITELFEPLVVRRSVAFAEAVFSGKVEVEGVSGYLAENLEHAQDILGRGDIPVRIDPEGESLELLKPLVVVDARMTKKAPETDMDIAPLVIGLGPGFSAGEDCHAVVETKRGHSLGRVIWKGSAEENTGVPGSVQKYNVDRVLRAPAEGELIAHAEIGDSLKEGTSIAQVNGQMVKAPFEGVLRGLLYPGIQVTKGLKIGDLDPRNDVSYTRRVSDKALAIGGGVLEAMLSRSYVREKLWE